MIFPRIFRFFSNSMIFPCMELFDFPGFPWFQELVRTLWSEDILSWSGTQHDASDESQTSNTLNQSLTLYQWITAIHLDIWHKQPRNHLPRWQNNSRHLRMLSHTFIEAWVLIRFNKVNLLNGLKHQHNQTRNHLPRWQNINTTRREITYPGDKTMANIFRYCLILFKLFQKYTVERNERTYC